jgi:hypothetical protein
MAQREKFEGHKKLPQGLHPRTVRDAHIFKAEAKEVYEFAVVRRIFRKLFGLYSQMYADVIDFRPSESTRKAYIGKSRSNQYVCFAYALLHYSYSAEEEECRQTVKGNFDWVEASSGRKLVPREYPAKPAGAEVQSEHPCMSHNSLLF